MRGKRYPELPSRPVRFTPILIGLTFLVLYWATLAPDVVGHDAGEFQFVPYIFGIPHATGYPLYLLLGKAWSFLPLGSVAWRMNLLSAFAGAAAAALTYLCAIELTESPAAGLVSSFAVGFAPLQWTWSTIAGVRSLAVAFVAAVILLALKWSQQVRIHPDIGSAITLHAASGSGDRRFLAVAFVSGLALAHHRTILLLLPFLAIYLVWTDFRQLVRLKLLGLAAGLFLLPLALYGILPWRAAHGAPWDQLHPNTWMGFVNLAIAGNDSAAHLDLTVTQTLARVPLLGQAMLAAFPAIVLALSAIGMVWLFLSRPAAAVMLFGYAALVAALTLAWHLGDQLNTVYFMAAYVPIGLFAGAGLWCLKAQIERMGHARFARWMAVAGAAAVLAAGLAANQARFRPAPEVLDDFRQNLFSGHQARRLADAFATLPPNAVVVCDWDQASVFWYAQFVDGVNKGIAISYPTATLASTLEKARGPVFLAAATVQPPPGAFISSWGPFVQVLPEVPTAPPADLIHIGGSFDNEIELLGLAPPGQPHYGVLPITVYFRAIRPPSGDYAVSVRLMPNAGQVAAQNDQPAPALGLSPTSHWTSGEVVADYHELDLRGLRDGGYDLAVVLYQPLAGGKFRNLSYQGAERALLGRLTVAAGRVSFMPQPSPAGA